MSLDWGNLAFGSCTSYDLRDWVIFTDAILPSMPDAWLWAGDFVYLDDSDMDCSSVDLTVTELPEWQTTCNCSGSWLTTPPYSCHAGDVEYIRNRWQWALNNAPYNAFLDYMCPTARSLGLFPPPGTNSKVCKPLMGIYDDHGTISLLPYISVTFFTIPLRSAAVLFFLINTLINTPYQHPSSTHLY